MPILRTSFLQRKATIQKRTEKKSENTYANAREKNKSQKSLRERFIFPFILLSMELELETARWFFFGGEVAKTFINKQIIVNSLLLLLL